MVMRNWQFNYIIMKNQKSEKSKTTENFLAIKFCYLMWQSVNPSIVVYEKYWKLFQLGWVKLLFPWNTPGSVRSWSCAVHLSIRKISPKISLKNQVTLTSIKFKRRFALIKWRTYSCPGYFQAYHPSGITSASITVSWNITLE